MHRINNLKVILKQKISQFKRRLSKVFSCFSRFEIPYKSNRKVKVNEEIKKKNSYIYQNSTNKLN